MDTNDCANGLIAHMDGPYECRKHDSGMLAESGLLTLLNTYSHDPAGNQLCIYGDPAYPLRIHLQAPFRGPGLTHIQKQYNKAMSRVRVSVEWVFGDIVNYFGFVDFKKNLKIGLSSIGKMYLVCGIICAHLFVSFGCYKIFWYGTPQLTRLFSMIITNRWLPNLYFDLFYKRL